MSVRIIAREARLLCALEGLRQSRSRQSQLPATLVERQRRDHRVAQFDSSKPVAVLATVKALSEGMGVDGANAAASGGGSGYYDGGGFGGGGGGEQN